MPLRAIELPTLHTLRAATLPAAAAGLPTRLVVFPWGRHDTRRGPFIVSDLTAQVFAANQSKMRLDGRLALDFEHNTLPGTEAYKSSEEPRPIAALAVCKVIPGEGIVYEDIEWTPEGRKAVEGGHYQDLSPSPFRDKAGNVIGLHSVALCRHGEVDGLTLHAAASPRIAEFLSALSADPFLIPPTRIHPPMKDALLKLLKLLDIEIADEADDTAMTTALSAGCDKVTALKAAAAKPAAEPMSADVTALRADVANLRKENLIFRATQEGKVIPLSAAAIADAPLSVLEELVKTAKPGQVHTQARTADGGVKSGEVQPGAEALSAETLNLAAQMGVSEDDLKKYGGV